MHNLVIDIGNTNSKVAVFREKMLVFFKSLEENPEDELKEIIKKYDIVNTTFSSVKQDVSSEITAVLEANTHYTVFSTQVNTGVKNYYQSLSTLGQDRWAKVIAVHQQFPGQNCLVIDAGTCVTYDLLDSDEAYYGGSISPGIGMRFKALNHYTGKLPLINWGNNLKIIPPGTDTETAILNGVLQGVVNEITGFIAESSKNNIDLKIVITGGDATFLLEQLKNSIFAPQITHDPYLVLKGLNEVIALKYVQKD
jgi:type III pantothenate kinase